MLIPKNPPLRDKTWLKEVREMPCLITGTTPCDAAHIRFGWLRGGQKPPDNRVVPLSRTLHMMQHSIGSEEKFWTQYAPPALRRKVQGIIEAKGGEGVFFVQGMIWYAEALYDDWKY